MFLQEEAEKAEKKVGSKPPGLLAKLTRRQKHYLFVSLAAVVGFGLIFFVSYLFEKRSASHKAEVVQGNKKMSLLTEKVKKDLWIASEGLNIKALEKNNEAAMAGVAALRKEIEELKELKNNDVSQPKDKNLPKNKNKVLPPLPMPLPTAGDALEASQGNAKPPFQQGGNQPPLKQPGPLDSQRTIRTFQDESVKKEVKEVKESKVKDKGKDLKQWLSSGSFMKAVLLNGIDAPTSGGAQSEPYPVLMTVTDLSYLPNRFKMNLKECFVVGAGFGNISDERAYIRTETLSCVSKDGKAIEVPLKGNIVGEDGKLGMRGRIVSKQGQQIAMSIFAGTLSGLGQALRPQQALALNLNPTGTQGVAYPDPKDVLLGAGMGGASNALTRVAEYYLKMAEKLFPIIEVDAGRRVEIIVLKGQDLDVAGKKR